MAQASFPEPKSLNKLEIGGGLPDIEPEYTVANPHPMYGKDPNIINPMGHTMYPKMIYPKGKSEPGIVVNSEAEEASYSEIKPSGAPWS